LTMHYMKRPRGLDEPRLLPLDYVAGPYVVMIGRGRRCLNNEGNRRFRAMVKAELQAYSVGRKAKKSSIIKRILREIRDNCVDGDGFIKQDATSGRYYTATTAAAKVTVAQAFRDALNDTIGYKSSKQHKQFKRDIARGKLNPEELMTNADELGVCSSCREELQPATDGMADDTPADSVRPKGVCSEPSLRFWKDDAGPVEEADGGGVTERTKSASTQDGDRRETHPGVAVKEDFDQFEPIPLEMAMKSFATVRAEVWGISQAAHEAVDHSEDHSEHSSNSSSPTHEDSDDTDDEDHAMVAWASEFVHCPLCSLVRGRGDLKELPIQDIRKALIG
jgi:hypothetical protein